MASRFNFLPEAAVFPDTAFPQLQKLTTPDRMVLSFDQSTVEACYWTGIVPDGWTGTITAYIYYIAAANSGKVDFEVSVEAVSDGDAVDLDAGSSFDTVNTITAPTVPATAGYIDVITCTLSNDDGAVAGDYIRFKLERDADDATNDTLAADCHVLGMEIQDGA